MLKGTCTGTWAGATTGRGEQACTCLGGDDLVEDDGPRDGHVLPARLAHVPLEHRLRFTARAPLRDPPEARAGGGGR
jgi:hypothetical protein